MIGIINYGCGNLGSIENMLQYLNIKTMIISEPKDIKKTDKLILPGVGSYDFGIDSLRSSGFIEPLNYSVLIEKIPILGICLGMQLMTNRSEEGDVNGLGWIDADTVKFENRPNFNVPHMGWNYVHEYE
jgi:imidazole glycerol-phosphate synthase subunit HisH